MVEESDELFGPVEGEAAAVVEAPASEPAPVETAPVVESVEPVQAPVETPTVPEASAPVEVPQPNVPDGYVPVAVLQQERARRQALEAAQQSQPTQQPIDLLDDPEGFQRVIDQRLAATEAKVTFDLSERFARQQFGSEAVDGALDWALERAQRDPVFAASYASDPDPIGYIVRQHQTADRLSALEKDEVAFARSILEKHGLSAAPVQQLAAAPAPTVAVPTPPRSIVAQPSVGGTAQVALGEEATFAEVFKD